jgi:hypothetical protein
MDHRVKHTPLAPSKNESRRDIPTTICAVVAGGLTLAAVCGKKVGLSASARIGAGVLGTGSALVALIS